VYVQAIVVLGHSDCKAMNLLYSLRHEISTPAQGPLQQWLKLHGQETVAQFDKLESSGDFKRKLKFHGAQKHEVEFEAFIDPKNEFVDSDKFSQVEIFPSHSFF
jgi:carbonic anhydrase